MKRESWGSSVGFILAVAGSAIGLANIWRFPYLVGENGGAAFVAVYLLSLLLVGFPVLMAEIVIGRTTRQNPSGAFLTLGKNRVWGAIGKMTIITGLIVSAFYSAVAGWVLGYFIESLKGTITSFVHPSEAITHFESLVQSPFFTLSNHAFFLAASLFVVYFGVRRGIERANKVMMPLLFLLLIVLTIYGIQLTNADQALYFLWSPDFSLLTPTAILAALGQSFFTLSLGQGTMVTYGSYLSRKDSLIKSCVPVMLMDTLVSLLAAVIVFTIVFSVGQEPATGPALVFHTLPFVFSQMTAGSILAPIFFLLVTLAALSSEISALEPSIAYLIDSWGFTRKKAVMAVGSVAFLIGVPCALSLNMLKESTVFGLTFLDATAYLASNVLIPLGGLAAVILVGWRWGSAKGIEEVKEGSSHIFETFPLLSRYFSFCFKYAAPLLIVIVFLHALFSP